MPVPVLPDSNPELVPGYVTALRATYQSHATQSLEWRVEQLHKYLNALRDPVLVEPLLEGIHADLHKSRFEGRLAEIDLIIHEIEYALSYLEKHTQLLEKDAEDENPDGQSFSRRDPYGVVLIMSPWNFPAMLSLVPLVGALACGNTALLRVATYTSNTANAMLAFIAKVFDPSVVQIVKGGRAITQAVLSQRFDYIFFTGGSTLGKIVYKAATDHFTPVSLELGGSCPTFVLDDLDDEALELAAKRLTWGKFHNAGQVCIAPQNFFVAKSKVDAFVQHVIDNINTLYVMGEDATEFDAQQKGLSADDLKAIDQEHAAEFAKSRLARIGDAEYKSMSKYTKQSPFFGRIVTKAAATRHVELITADKKYVVYGGDHDIESRYVEPTVMLFPTLEEFLNSETIKNGEIFGPIIPIVGIENNVLDAAIPIVNSGEKPLALYLFTENKEAQDRVLAQTSSGACVVNDAIIHLFNINIPFGGVGHSGMGGYHGKHSFLTFSHEKAVLFKDFVHANDRFNGRFPPHNSQ